MSNIIIAPSVLAADMLNLGKETKRAVEAGADWLHLDVMDGVYVPNMSFGFDIIKAIGTVSTIPMDVHMMTVRPDKYLEKLAEIGSYSVSIHEGTCENTREALLKIKSLGMKAAIAVKPKESAEIVEKYIDIIDMALVMTVEPGFGGQKFMVDMMPKIAQIKKCAENAGRKIDIQVDGGVNAETAKICYENGANSFVCGTALFRAEDMKKECEKIHSIGD